MPGEKIDLNGVNIHYEKVGTGSIVVLLLPGGIGKLRKRVGTDYFFLCAAPVTAI